MDTVQVCFYLDRDMKTVTKNYNVAEINAIFLSGEVYMNEKEYKVGVSSFYVDKNELGIDLIDK